MANKLEITLTRSVDWSSSKINVKQLKLLVYVKYIKLLNKQDNAAIRGMINKVAHLVTVKEHIIYSS